MRHAVQGTEVEHPCDQIVVGQSRRHGGKPPWPHHVIGVTECQETAKGHPHPDVASRPGPSTLRCVHEVDVRTPIGPSQHTRTGVVVRAVVGNHHFPAEHSLLGRQRLELVLEPRHTVSDGHHHADQWGFARMPHVRHLDVLHDHT